VAVSGRGRGRGLSPWIVSGFGLRKQTAWGSSNEGQRTALLDWYLGQVTISGTLVYALAGDAMVASGTALNPTIGTWSSTLVDDTMIASGSMMQPPAGGVDRRRRT
jgi:hypothetical protein